MLVRPLRGVTRASSVLNHQYSRSVCTTPNASVVSHTADSDIVDSDKSIVGVTVPAESYGDDVARALASAKSYQHEASKVSHQERIERNTSKRINRWLGDKEVRRETAPGWRYYVVDGIFNAFTPPERFSDSVSAASEDYRHDSMSKSTSLTSSTSSTSKIESSASSLISDDVGAGEEANSNGDAKSSQVGDVSVAVEGVQDRSVSSEDGEQSLLPGESWSWISTQDETLLPLMYGGAPGELRQFPSVTTINNCVAKPFLAPWATKLAVAAFGAHVKRDQATLHAAARPDRIRANSELASWVRAAEALALSEPDRVRDEAALVGTAAHTAIDDIISGERSASSRGLPYRSRNIVDGFLLWRDDTPELTIERGETLVYSERYGYAGELDALARDRDGRLVVLDWKTSNALHRDYALQLSAYAQAVEELTGEEVSAAWVVRFGKFKPTYEARRVADLKESFETFKASLRLFTYHTAKYAPDAWSHTRTGVVVPGKQRR